MTIFRNMRLRARLILAYTGLIVLAFAGLAFFAGRQISTAAEEDYEKHLEQQAVIVSEGLSEIVQYYREGVVLPAELAAIVRSYSERTDARLTVMDTDGVVWIDSAGFTYDRRQTDYPEVVAALNDSIVHDIRLDEQGQQTIYTATPIIGDGEMLGVVRLAAPAEFIRTSIAQRWLTFGLGFALLLALSVIASLRLSTSLTRPLEQLRASALRLAGGDLSMRLPEERNDEIGELAQSFNHLARQVQAMLEEQRAFAANASHELRTPLTTIRLRTEALRAGAVDEATTRQYIAEIDDEALRLSGLVEDLILLSRLDAGRAEPGSELIDPMRFARQLTREIEPLLESQGLTFTLDMPGHLPPVEASSHHMRVVFRNLLDNAIKYTPSGGHVIWRLWAEDGWLHGEVCDTGQGIDPEALPHLFERFYRADRTHSRRVPGVGLGLSLTRSVVQFYGGTLDITSEGHGKGTTAHVRWPLLLGGQ